MQFFIFTIVFQMLMSDADLLVSDIEHTQYFLM
jgi:hypothetical protein